MVVNAGTHEHQRNSECGGGRRRRIDSGRTARGRLLRDRPCQSLTRATTFIIVGALEMFTMSVVTNPTDEMEPRTAVQTRQTATFAEMANAMRNC
jgi:hypothetical protein